MTVNILGTKYAIIFKKRDDDPELKVNETEDGYCNSLLKEIVLTDLSYEEDYKNHTAEEIVLIRKNILRHEIVHAFFFESGLASSSFVCESSWAMNEEMIDWFAIQGPKIYSAWQAVDAL